jgi:signal peptidase I
MVDVRYEIISWVKTILCAVLFALIITNFVIVNATVPTGSMEATIMTNDRIIAFRQAYLFSEPKRFDIVVFRYPDDETERFVKRVIGLPGDSIYITGGRVYLNGSVEPIEDAYIREVQDVEDDMTFEVPEGCYFMMGDNRNHSSDSRHWENHFVNEKKILGRVVARYYPVNRMRVY